MAGHRPAGEPVGVLRAPFGARGFEPSVGEPVGGQAAIALFGRESPEHIARHLGDGRWTSKLGRSVDIAHRLRAIEGELYSRVLFIMVR